MAVFYCVPGGVCGIALWVHQSRAGNPRTFLHYQWLIIWYRTASLEVDVRCVACVFHVPRGSSGGYRAVGAPMMPPLEPYVHVQPWEVDYKWGRCLSLKGFDHRVKTRGSLDGWDQSDSLNLPSTLKSRPITEWGIGSAKRNLRTLEPYKAKSEILMKNGKSMRGVL